jgi:hypothetical protein
LPRTSFNNVDGLRYFLYSDGKTDFFVAIQGTATLFKNGLKVRVPAGYMTWSEPGARLAQPVPATRSAIAALFGLPPIAELTNGALDEADVFCEPLQDVALSVNGNGDTTGLSWEAHGGCGQFNGVITAKYTYAGFSRDLAVKRGSGNMADAPPPAGCGSANAIEYTLDLQDEKGQRVTAETTVSRDCSHPKAAQSAPQQSIAPPTPGPSRAPSVPVTATNAPTAPTVTTNPSVAPSAGPQSSDFSGVVLVDAATDTPVVPSPTAVPAQPIQ